MAPDRQAYAVLLFDYYYFGLKFRKRRLENCKYKKGKKFYPRIRKA